MKEEVLKDCASDGAKGNCESEHFYFPLRARTENRSDYSTGNQSFDMVNEQEDEYVGGERNQLRIDNCKDEHYSDKTQQ